MSLSEAKRKKQIGAANAAFSVGNSWAFARRFRLRVKGFASKEQDTPLKEQDCHLKAKGRHTVSVLNDFFTVGSSFRSEA